MTNEIKLPDNNGTMDRELANFIADRLMDHVERGDREIDGQLVIDAIESYKMGVRS